jgi:phenylacetate 2-hydroxylase
LIDGAGEAMHSVVFIVGIGIVWYFVHRLLFRNEQAKIRGMPEVPGYPIFGNLVQLGTQHAVQCKEWAREYGPVFQLRFGNKRVVVANSFKAVKELWIDHQVGCYCRTSNFVS